MPIYAFGPFLMDGQRRRLLRDGQPVPLPPRAFDVLLALVEQRGRVVEKTELLQTVWPDVAVEDGNLTQHIFTIRRLLGEEQGDVKFVATVPRRGYQFVADVTEVPSRDGSDRWGAHELIACQPRTLAVLPFVPLDAADDDQGLGFGMADALIMRLGNVRQVRVRPTSAVRRYVAAKVDVLTVARELGVDLVVEGSIQRVGDRIRVTVQLVRASEGSSVWGTRFDERMTDIFAVQDSIAEHVASLLVPHLSEVERRRLRHRDTTDVEALQACLRGRHHLARRTPDALGRAVNEFEQAVLRDPGYALAYAGLAECLTILGAAGYEERGRAAAARARLAAERAVELDGELADARVALGLVNFRLDWRWLDAEREFTRATNLNPGLASAYHFYGLYLSAMGRAQEALAAIRRAQSLDPLSLIINAAVGRVHHFARAYDAAIAQYLATLELDPNFADAHMNLGLTYVEQGRHEEAMRAFQRAVDLSGRRSLLLAMQGYACGLHGHAEGARQAIEELAPLAERGEVSAILPAYPSIGLGETDLAFRWLDRAAEERAGLLIYLGVEPMFDRLRDDPRLKALMQHVRLAC